MQSDCNQNLARMHALEFKNIRWSHLWFKRARRQYIAIHHDQFLNRGISANKYHSFCTAAITNEGIQAMS